MRVDSFDFFKILLSVIYFTAKYYYSNIYFICSNFKNIFVITKSIICNEMLYKLRKLIFNYFSCFKLKSQFFVRQLSILLSLNLASIIESHFMVCVFGYFSAQITITHFHQMEKSSVNIHQNVSS